MQVDEKTLNTLTTLIAQKVQQRMGAEEKPGPSGQGSGVFQNMNDAIEAAFKAQKTFFECYALKDRRRIIEKIREYLTPHIEELARLGVEDTGMGRVDHKILKHQLVIQKTPGVEDLQSASYTGDDGLTLIEYSPFGVIGAITPSTNPSETVICNSIGMIASGNSVVFSPHPGAKKVSALTVRLINEAIALAGGPENLVVTVGEPTMEQASIMMKHPKVRMLVATGGPAVVDTVLSSGKKAIGAGAGNPPVLVDKTADIEKAAADIVAGASFDNNLPCIAEKECIVVADVADYLIFNMQKAGAFLLKDPEDIKRLEQAVLTEKGAPSRSWIGKDAHLILKRIGIITPETIPLIILETTADHPFVQEELMMPILPIVRVADVEAGIQLAFKCEHGNRHTAMVHSKDVDVLSRFARLAETTIFVKNAPSYAGIGVGGEGYTTFTIAGPTGEGLTSAKSFTRIRRCVLAGGFMLK